MHRDIVLRWIQTLSALIARLLRREPGVTVDLARIQLEDARAMLLGALDQLVSRLPPEQVAALLADPHRIYGYAQLTGLESALERVAGRPDLADALAARSVALGREALARSEDQPSEWADWITAAEREVSPPIE